MSGLELASDIRSALAQMQARGALEPAAPESGLAGVRASYDRMGQFLSEIVPPVRIERELTVDGDGREIPCTLVADTADAAVAVVYFHGGGFAQGRACDWLGFARTMARSAPVAVLLVEYRLAPEHPFPAAVEDALDVMTALREKRIDLELPNARIATGGDSAGGALAMVAAMTSNLAVEQSVGGVLLFYPVLEYETSDPSWERLGGFGLNAPLMRTIWERYCPAPDKADWHLAPAGGPLHVMPRVLVATGQYDPLTQQSIRLYDRLDALGVPVDLRILAGANHAFNRLGPLCPRVETLLRSMAQDLVGDFT